MIDGFVKWLKNNSWCVYEYDNSLKFDRLKDALSRYNFIEESYLEFLSIVKSAVNEKDETL
ncbi:hypothetical protein [Acetivibrio clariflavus]|uniref:Uncharacterized protein n=1 Tax=Acetivibrio clariflavus (strain DSM 19732 / NBRC 101661 / EBR45) TaxID=720554 RepID=G8LVX0_ACECE|nr:hypothetical protein [Acetivibrio clariflavus]AEV67537.1 hypothetical protein Clocl_0850 [Acetivibrio clariflavus DSM 19732]